MANPPPLSNPWVWTAVDRYRNPISLSASFNATTRIITVIVLYRHPQCDLDKILIGLGVDNRPNSTDKVIDVPAGRTRLPPVRLSLFATRGVSTIDNLVNSYQITAA